VVLGAGGVVDEVCELGGALVGLVGGELPPQPEPQTVAANRAASSPEPGLTIPISALSLPAIG
jgi:hypothetical protein